MSSLTGVIYNYITYSIWLIYSFTHIFMYHFPYPTSSKSFPSLISVCWLDQVIWRGVDWLRSSRVQSLWTSSKLVNYVRYLWQGSAVGKLLTSLFMLQIVSRWSYKDRVTLSQAHNRILQSSPILSKPCPRASAPSPAEVFILSCVLSQALFFARYTFVPSSRYN